MNTKKTALQKVKNFFNVLLVILLTLSTGVSNVAMAASKTTRESHGSQYITSAKVLDKNGDKLDSSRLYDSIQVSFDFDIPQGENIKEGDTMVVNLPDVLNLPSKVTFDVKDASGNVVATAVADPETGNITLTFTDYAEKTIAEGGTHGSFNVWVSWNKDNVHAGDKVPVFDQVVNIEKDGEAGILNKIGWINPNDPTQVVWRVVINAAQQNIDKAVYTDSIGENQTLVPGSVSVYHIIWTNYPYDFQVGEAYPKDAFVQDSNTKFHVNLGDIQGTVYIDYVTQTTNGGKSTTYKNSGKLTGENINDTNIDAETPYNGGEGQSDTTTSISGVKTWKDDNNAEGTRPDSITVNLLANDKKVDSKTVTAADNWEYMFTNLEKYDQDGKLINYTISEDTVKGYLTTVNGNDITNTLSDITSVNGEKTWKDDNNSEKTRPDTITVNLLANGKKVDSQQVSTKENWKYEFTNLDKYDDNGKLITYTVSEVSVPGYVTTVNGNNLTNTLKGSTEVAGEKFWEDNNNSAGIRPDTITVNLFANGKQVDRIKVSEKDDWKYAFKNLPKYDENGKAIKYTISEAHVPGYVTTVKGFNLVNTMVAAIPTLPNVPIIPTTPVVPTLPVEPTTPVTPVVPTLPVEPATPVTPVVPTLPVEPTTPVTPVVPTLPVEPTTPVTPVVPTLPVEPTTPVTPVVPTLPVEPTTPVKPVVPKQPVTPEEPIQPIEEEPSIPKTPTVPSSKNTEAKVLGEIVERQIPTTHSAATSTALPHTSGEKESNSTLLPHTGESTSSKVAIIGIVILAISFIGFVFYKKRNASEE